MLNREQCKVIYEKNGGKRVWLEPLCANDYRLLLRNENEILHCWDHAEVDKEEQAQAARLCAGINSTVKQT